MKLASIQTLTDLLRQPFSIVWTPEGKIIYEHLTTAVDRFEGNTKGA